MARLFVTTSLADGAGTPSSRGDQRGGGTPPPDVFVSPAACRAALEALPPSAEHMTFFEYNFLFVLAAGGKPEKAALGDHSAAGYRQRARFYAVSPEARLLFAKRIAAYLIFLVENTGLATKERCAATGRLLARYTTLDAMLGDISR